LTGLTGFSGLLFSLFPEERVKVQSHFSGNKNLLERAMILFVFLQERQKKILFIL
jgi:hypothetical protein